MAHPLQQRVDDVRRGARRIVWLHALGRLSAAVLIAAFVAALIDFVLRPMDVAVRWLLTLSVIAIGVWGARRWVLPAWRYRPSRLETAQRIELFQPQLAGRLASTMEFLLQAEHEEAAGSAALRKRVIAEAGAASAGLDFSAALDKRPQRYGLAAAASAALVIAVFALVSWQSVALAAARLAMPWSPLSWPRWNHLQFVDIPPRLARGDALELVVVDENRRLPDSVTVQVQFDDGELLREEMKFLDGRMVHRLDNIGRSFRYRAYGGDDDTMPWRHLEVVEPLQVRELQVTVHPPAYAGLPSAATGAVVTMLEDTRLALEGDVDQPLQSARVVREGTSEGVDLAIGAEGLSFSLAADAASPWKPKKSGAYVLQLTSAEGVLTQEAARWDLRLLPDTPPTVQVQSPADGAYATPGAALPVAATAKDDLALSAVHLRFLRPGLSDEQSQSLELWQAESNPLLRVKGGRGDVSGRSHGIEGQWDLQAVFGLQPGDVLSWYVEARDFRPQTGQTPTARLTIISPEEMQQRLVQRQQSALSQLVEAHKRQREAHTQVGGLKLQWSEIGRWRPSDRDLLHSAELQQRHVESLVGRSATGATTILAGVLEDLRINRLQLPEMAARCEELLLVLEELEGKLLPNVTAHFSELLREARQESGGKGTTEGLASLEQKQAEVAGILESLLEKLVGWDSVQRIRRDLDEIREDQRALFSSTQKLQLEVISSGKPDSQQQADARQIARRQSELGRQLEKLLRRLADLQHSEVDPAVARKAAAVAELAGKLAITAKMRESARAAEDLKLGQSVQIQQDVDHALAELLDALAGRLEDDRERAVQELRDLANSLATLEREQGNLADKLEQQPDKEKLPDLEAEQHRLERRANDLVPLLERKQAPSAAQSATDAASSMKKAADAAQKKDASTAAQQARNAQQKLQDARRDVNEQITQRQADLLREQMARLEQHIQGLIVRQEAAKREAERLLELKARANGQLTESQTASVGDLAAEQEGLSGDARALSEGSQLPDAFALQLEWTAGDMSSAAGRLRQAQLDSTMPEMQQSAVDRLQMIVEALQSASAAGSETEAPPMGEPPPMPPPADNAPPPDLHDLAEVKLLRAMQAEVNRQTSLIEKERTAEGSLPPAAQQKLDELAIEQGRVAELAIKLVRSLGGPARSKDDNKDSPPSVSDEDFLRKLDEALLPGNPPSEGKK